MRRRTRDDRGSIAVFTGLIMVVLLIISAFVVDIGMQRVARRDMQALADTVALDLGRLIGGGRTRSQIETGAARFLPLSTARSNSIARNATRVVGKDADLDVQAYLVELIDDASDPDTALDNYAMSGGVPVQVPSSGVPTAVVVRALTRVDFGFGAVVGVNSGGASRSAVGVARSTACFRLGSYAAGLSSSQSALLTSLLNGALGVDVMAVGYQGLVNSDISLLDLATRLGLGGVDELATATVTTRQLFVAAAQVMQTNGDTANANLLNSIAAQINPIASIPIAGLATIATGNGAGASAAINALDLVSGAAFLSNGTNALSIPSLGTNLGLTGTGLTSSVKIIEKAQLACGVPGVQASTSQGEVAIRGTLASVSAPNLTGLTITAGGTDILLSLASAVGTMTQIVCGSGTTTSPQGVDVSVQSQLATAARLQQTVSVNGSVTDSALLGNLLGGLLGSIVRVEIKGTLQLTTTTSQSAATRPVQIRVPNDPPNWDTGKSSGSGTLGLDQSAVSAVWTTGPTFVAKNILGLTVSLSTQQVANLTNSLVTNLTNGVLGNLLPAVNTQLLVPLQKILGLELAGATVFGVPTPSCESPTLVG